MIFLGLKSFKMVASETTGSKKIDNLTFPCFVSGIACVARQGTGDWK